MFDWIMSTATDIFHWMDDFGSEHWGFILAFVFAWWFFDRLINGVRKDINWIRNRRNANVPRPNGMGQMAKRNWSQNNPPRTGLGGHDLSLNTFGFPRADDLPGDPMFDKDFLFGPTDRDTILRVAQGDRP